MPVQYVPIKERVVEIVVRKLKLDESEVTPEKNFSKDLGADSLNMVELCLELESQFELDIPEEDAEKIKTVQDVIDYTQGELGVE